MDTGRIWSRLRKALSSPGSYLNRISFWISLLSVLIALHDLGFDPYASIRNHLNLVYLVTLAGGSASLVVRYLSGKTSSRPVVWFFDAALFFFLSLLLIQQLWGGPTGVFKDLAWVYAAIFLVFIREFSALNVGFYQRFFNPAQLFIASFLGLVLTGAFLLLLPRSTHAGISFIDALFTSTSAVCVTGLVVVDTGSYFTRMGQIIILILIQAGGIGIMTFTSYFSYFFRGSASYENQLMLKDMTNAEKMGEVFESLKKIILLTFAIEAFGAGFIFLSLDGQLFSSTSEQVFFSIFHTISAFCNAGFSTLPNSLYESPFRFNYPLHLVIAVLFIIGGIGFPICFNLFRYLKHVFLRVVLKRQINRMPWIVHINSRIVFITTGILLLSGTALFYLFEYQNTLAEHQGIGKIVTAFFGAATPRTAGFNTVDTSALHLSTLMVIFLFMWVGASPGSTGGGIKTTAFALATLNFLSLAKGKDRMEIFRREVSEISVRRAFAVISLSLIVIGVSVFLLAVFDTEKDLLHIAFESFSAYSTVGLSLGITGTLSVKSKLVIIVTMFIGRVSMLTLLAAFLRKIQYLKYRYPSEDILIT